MSVILQRLPLGGLSLHLLLCFFDLNFDVPSVMLDIFRTDANYASVRTEPFEHCTQANKSYLLEKDYSSEDCHFSLGSSSTFLRTSRRCFIPLCQQLLGLLPQLRCLLVTCWLQHCDYSCNSGRMRLDFFHHWRFAVDYYIKYHATLLDLISMSSNHSTTSVWALSSTT